NDADTELEEDVENELDEDEIKIPENQISTSNGLKGESGRLTHIDPIEPDFKHELELVEKENDDSSSPRSVAEPEEEPTSASTALEIPKAQPKPEPIHTESGLELEINMLDP